MKKTIATLAVTASLIVPAGIASADTGHNGVGHSGRGQEHTDKADLPSPDLSVLVARGRVFWQHVLHP